MCKLFSVLMLPAMGSYLALTLMAGFFTANALWKLFELVRSYRICNDRVAAICILFLPSVIFWCAGVSKHTLVFIFSIHLIVHLFYILSKDRKTRFTDLVVIGISTLVILSIRSYVVGAIAVPLAFALVTRLSQNYTDSKLVRMTLQFIVFAGGIVVIGAGMVTGESSDPDNFLNQAAVIQQDFANNQTYGDNRYSLGLEEFTPAALLGAAPLAILTGVYRPGIWEALSGTLILNGIESLLLIFLTFRFFAKGFRKRWSKLQANEFLVFCLGFCLILAFITGATSVLFGVLVRFRALLLPFLGIILTIGLAEKKEEDETEILLTLD